MQYILKAVSAAFFIWSITSCKPSSHLSQDSNWRYITAYVQGYDHKLNFQAAKIGDSLANTCNDQGLQLCIYEQPGRFFSVPTIGGSLLKAALINRTNKTIHLDYLGGLYGLTTEVKKGEEWVVFQRLVGMDAHAEQVPVCSGCFVDIAIHLKAAGHLTVPYRVRLVTAESVVFSNEIMINCSKAQYGQAGIPFPDE